MTLEPIFSRHAQAGTPGFGEAPQPLIQNHPLVTGEAIAAFTPHRPPRPDKSEGGAPLDIRSELEPKGDQPAAIEELEFPAGRFD